MSQQLIDTTTGAGDTGKAGGDKINANFTELYRVRGQADPRLVMLMNRVRAGKSTMINNIAPSTGVQDTTSRWPYITAAAMGTDLAAYGSRVEFWQARGTSEPTHWLAFKPTVRGVAGALPRRILFDSTGNQGSPRTMVPSLLRTKTAAGLQVVIGFDPASATPAAFGTVIVSGIGNGSRMFRIDQQVDGSITLIWNQQTVTAGTDATSRSATWTQAQIGYVPGTPLMYNFTITEDNGSSGSVIRLSTLPMSTFYYEGSSPNSQTLTWGTPLVPSSYSSGYTPDTMVTTVNKPVLDAAYIQAIGSRGASVSPFFGTIFNNIFVLDGENGGFLSSPCIEDYVGAGAVTATYNSYLQGPGTLSWWNAAAAGKNIPWVLGTDTPVDPMRPNRLFVPGSSLTINGHSHNEGIIGAALRTRLEGYDTQMKILNPYTNIMYIHENVVGQLTGSPGDRANKGNMQIIAFAIEKGYAIADFFSRLLLDSRGYGNIQTQNVHPIDGQAYTLEAQEMKERFGLL